MNYSTAVFLINDKVRAIACTYEEDGPKTIFKTLNAEIGVDDLVIVPTNTRHMMTVCKVTAVDVDVDYDSSTQMSWIIDTVDTTDYDVVLGQEAQAIEAVKSAEKRRRKDELRAAVFKDQEESMKSLAITSLDDGEK